MKFHARQLTSQPCADKLTEPSLKDPEGSGQLALVRST
jgi:hypothetical protein